MSFEASLFVAVFIILSAVFFVLVKVSKGRMQAKEDELHKAATLRGWTFAKTMERGYRIYRYTGTTEGVAWEAESARRMSGGNSRHKRRQIARWHGKWSPGVTAPIVALGVPKGKEKMGAGVAQGDGMFARMAVKAAGFVFDKALDVYFGHEIGAEIDAGDLRRVEQPAVPGFIVMAGNVDEASRILSEGLHRALVDASNDAANVLSETDRPYVLVRPKGISLARMEQFRDVTEIDQFIRAGIGLARAFRFGRPG